MSTYSTNNSSNKRKTFNKRRSAREVCIQGVTLFTYEVELSGLARIASLLVLLNLRDTMKLKAIAERITFKTTSKDKSVQSFDIDSIISDLRSNVMKICHIPLYRCDLDAVAPVERKSGSLDNIVQFDEIKVMQNKIKMLKHQKNESDLIATNLCGDYTSYLTQKSYENRYLINILDSRIDEMKHSCDLKIDRLEKERDLYNGLIIREQGTFESQLVYLEEYNRAIKMKIDKTIRIQGENAEKLDNLLADAQNARDVIKKKYTDALQSFNDHREWVRHTRMTDAALVIQKSWRKILEERAELKAKQDALQAKKLKLLGKKKNRQ